MHTINSATDLRAAILHLEAVQDEERSLLREQFHLTYESIKPINLIKNTFRQVTESHEIKDNLISTAVGLTTGYLSKKLFVNVSDSPVKKLLGSALELGVITLVANNPEAVRALGNGIWSIISSLSGDEDADTPEEES